MDENKTEWLLEQPYIIVDFIPQRVEASDSGSFFTVENYCLQEPQLTEMRRKFSRIIMKLYCYYSIILHDLSDDTTIRSPEPSLLEEWIVSNKKDLHIYVEDEDALIFLSRDDTYITVYNPNDKISGLIIQLASSEGLFVRRPDNESDYQADTSAKGGDSMNNDNEKEVVFETELSNAESVFLKPMYGKKSRKFVKLIRIIYPVLLAEAIALFVLDKSDTRGMWGLLLFMMLLLGGIYIFIKPVKRRKYYNKVHAANEDSIVYTFYKDSVRIKNPSVEALLKYDTAEMYAEDKERFMIVFPFRRMIALDKRRCSKENIAFLRSIVPEENQKKIERKTSVKLSVTAVIVVLYSVMLAFMIWAYAKSNANTYHSDYQNTTYESFVACVDAGTIKDVVIIKDKYIEYTFSGSKGDERYSTVCPDDIEHLKEKLDKAYVNWITK